MPAARLGRRRLRSAAVPRAGGFGPPPGYGTRRRTAARPDRPGWFQHRRREDLGAARPFGGIIVGFIAPLVALLAKGNESPAVRPTRPRR